MTGSRSRAGGVVLVGPRGAGKSTLARALANHLGWGAADTDDLLAAEAGVAVGDLLASVGEAAFRRLEETVVAAALAGNRDRVLALGGGAVLSETTRSILARGEHFVVFLFAPVPVLVERCHDGPFRPPLTDLPPAEEVARLFDQRAPLYRSVSDLTLDTFSSNVAACVRSITASMDHPGG